MAGLGTEKCSKADYAIISDLHKVVPVLCEAIRKVKSQQSMALAIWPLEWTGGGNPDLITVRPAIWGWAVFWGVLYYARASWCYTIGLKQMPASMAGRFLNLIPIFGLAAACLFLGERLTVVQWISGMMIVLALVAMLPWQDATIVPPSPVAPAP